MPLNSSLVRTPSLLIIAAGIPIPGVMDLDVHANSHLAADRFRIRAAMTAAAAASLLQPDTILDLRIGLDGPPVSILVGEADSIVIDPLRNTIELEGRDLTRRLLDARTQETFANQTSSEIAATLATRHGLTPSVTATTTLAGRYYDTEHDCFTLAQFARATTEWDLLSFLAAREGFEVFVTAQTLHFHPRSDTVPSVTITPADCISLSLERALTLARDIEVTVKSWSTRQQAAVVQTARRARNGKHGSGGPPQQIVVVRPNLSSSDALALAQRILADLSGHERLVHAELPGDLILTPRSRVVLTGTDTDFDQVYYIAELDRSYSAAHGFTQRLRLKNADPRSSGA